VASELWWQAHPVRHQLLLDQRQLDLWHRALALDQSQLSPCDMLNIKSTKSISGVGPANLSASQVPNMQKPSYKEVTMDSWLVPSNRCTELYCQQGFLLVHSSWLGHRRVHLRVT